MNTPNATRTLTEIYRELDAACGLQHDKLRSARSFEHSLFIPTQDNLIRETHHFEALQARAEALPAPDPVFSLLKSHILDFIGAQRSSMQSSYEHPAGFIASLTNFLTYMGDKDSRDPDERARILQNRLSQVDDLWHGMRSIFPAAATGKLRDVAEGCQTLQRVSSIALANAAKHYAGLNERDVVVVAKSLDRLRDKAAMWTIEIAEAIESRPPESAAGTAAALNTDPERYRMVLDQELGVSLDELLSWHESEVEKTRNEMIETAARINPTGRAPVTTPLAAVELMNTYAGPCDSPAEMFARLRSYLDRAQVACRDWVKMPEESCRVIPVPEQFRLTYPWGGYGGGCPRRRPLIGDVFLNDTNYRAVTDGWIKINAVHECYPGHHVQWVRGTLDPLPETVKIGAKRVPLQEGMCHRTERLMEYLFDEDPYYPLAVAFRRHHTAVRIKADLYLQYFNRPEEEAIQLYMDELGFDRVTALGQVKSQEMQNRIGYFTCYYYGMKKLEDLERAYGYDSRTFTEYLFSVLNVSLTNFEAFLRLSEHDKQRFLTGFPSRLQFD